jgi:hypothetical protein
VRLTAALLLVLAVMSFGCAALRPADYPTASSTPSPDLEQAKIAEPDQDVPCGWAILYGLADVAGSVLANNPVIPYPDK